MSELAFLGSVALLYSLLAISPGPNFMAFTLSAASESRRHAVCVGLGVSTASMAWATLAALGLGVVLGQFAGLQRLLQMVGGLYLAYVGLRMLLPARTASSQATAPAARSLRSAYLYGLTTNLTNPKSLAFFSSAFAALFMPGLAPWTPWAAVAIVGMISVSWNLLVVAVFSHHRAQRGYRHAKPWIDRLTGSMLTFFGLKMVLGR